MDTTIDPQVKNLVSAIGETETGPTSASAYTTKGASGEYGRYQFMPDTWKAWAGQYLGDPNAPMSVENQNKVAYSQVKAWKDQGLNPAQIAAAWNAGEGSLKNDQWKTNVGTNAQGVAYNTPDYVRKVSSYYEANKSKTAAGGVAITPTAPAAPVKNRFLPNQNTNGLDYLKNTLGSILPPALSIAGGIGGAALAAPTGPVGMYAAGVAGSGMGAAAGTSLQEAMQGKKQAPGAIATQGAEYAGAEAIGVPVAKAAEPFVKAGIDAVAPVVKKGFDSAMSVIGRDADSLEAKAQKKIMDALTPRVTAKPYEKLGTSGTRLAEPSLTGKAGIDGSAMKVVQHAYDSLKNVAAALGKKASDIVSTGAGQVTKNVNRISDAISEYAQNKVAPFLKNAGVNYNFADLRKALEIIKPPGGLSEEATSAYNATREKILAAVANKTSPAVTGGRSLTELRGMAGGSDTIPAKDLKGDEDFWDARKIIDDIGDTETKGKIFASEAYSGANAAWKDLRGAYKSYLSDAFRYPGQMDKVNIANDFLSTSQMKQVDKTGWNLSELEKQFGLTPSPESASGAEEWNAHMSNLEGLYNARKAVASKLGTETGRSIIGIWTKEHPTVTKALRWGAGAIGLGALGGLGMDAVNHL